MNCFSNALKTIIKESGIHVLYGSENKQAFITFPNSDRYKILSYIHEYTLERFLANPEEFKQLPSSITKM